MGGGKSKSSNSYVTYDNDMVASDGGVVMGEGGAYTNIDGNEGTVLSLGQGASYINNSLDEKTRSLIDNSMVLMHDNAESAFEIAANLTGATDAAPEFMNAEINDFTAAEKADFETAGLDWEKEKFKWITGGAVALGVVALAVRWGLSK